MDERAPVVDVTAEFNTIVAANFGEQPEVAITEPITVEKSVADPDVCLPFGQFTTGVADPDNSSRAAMASSTGYTGNNGEESR